jgi:hypothetical protein
MSTYLLMDPNIHITKMQRMRSVHSVSVALTAFKYSKIVIFMASGTLHTSSCTSR